MITGKSFKNRVKKTFLRLFFGIMGVLVGLVAVNGILNTELVYAEPNTTETTETVTSPNQTNTTNNTETSNTATEEKADNKDDKKNEASCQNSLGALSWLICPVTEKIADAVDYLYEKIQGILAIDPISTEDGSPVYEIWKYCLNITNILFVIFLLIVVYSQLTGIGISNYGIKKTLPKLIVAAILVNLSFYICLIFVDVSNIFGNSLRGVFTTIQEATMTEASMNVSGASLAQMYGSIAGGVAIGALAIAVDPGMIWMLIPTALGAIVAVVTGLITIALRQAVVILLVMVSPLAIVAYMLPNTDQWYKKWKDLFIKMLVFYPAFSLLFGASQLAGFAIIAAAKDGFGLLLGIAVQIFPLFFSWKLMTMSGTFLSGINSWMRGFTNRPLAANRAWADSHRELTNLRYLNSRNEKIKNLPSVRLMNFLSNRKIAREEEMKGHAATIRNRGLAYNASRKYKNGIPTREAEEEYAEQAENMKYEQIIQRHKNNMNKGLGQLEAVKAGATDVQKARLNQLDMENVKASDDLKAEAARGAEIEYQNTKGHFERVLNAKLAEGDRRAMLSGNTQHKMHPGVLSNPENYARYERLKEIMEGQDDGVQTALADAASSAHAQAQIRRNKFQTAGDLTPATQNVADHIHDLVRSPNMVKNIDAIIGGLRVLNMRGDTDMVAKELEHDIIGTLCDSGKIELGTYASQALSNFVMFDVKDNDPVLRRFGKYINMQTAALYNDNDPVKRRTKSDVTWWEYVNSGYIEHDESGNVVLDEAGQPVIRKTRGMKELMTGTSYARVERTAYKAQREGVRAASHDINSDGSISQELSVDRYLDNMNNLYDSTLPNIISDQFSYLSGSEQIIALAKDLTGMGKDGKWDWKYIFGADFNPSLEQKAKFIMGSRNIVKKFLGGHVPSQIARSKTDMLQAIEGMYALLDDVMTINSDGEEVVDLARLEEADNREFIAGDENTLGSYKNFLKEKQDAVKERFRKSFKESALKTLAKQSKRGFQGESKDKLNQMLDLETLYDYYYPKGEGKQNNNKQGRVQSQDNDDNNQKHLQLQNNNSNDSQRRIRPRNDTDDEEDEDDGRPVIDSDDGTTEGGAYNDTREQVREIFERYRGPARLEVEDCWDEISSVLESSAEMGDLRVALNQFAEGLSQYTDVSQLHHDVMRIFFGND